MKRSIHTASLPLLLTVLCGCKEMSTIHRNWSVSRAPETFFEAISTDDTNAICKCMSSGINRLAFFESSIDGGRYECPIEYAIRHCSTNAFDMLTMGIPNAAQSFFPLLELKNIRAIDTAFSVSKAGLSDYFIARWGKTSSTNSVDINGVSIPLDLYESALIVSCPAFIVPNRLFVFVEGEYCETVCWNNEGLLKLQGEHPANRSFVEWWLREGFDLYAPTDDPCFSSSGEPMLTTKPQFVFSEPPIPDAYHLPFYDLPSVSNPEFSDKNFPVINFFFSVKMEDKALVGVDYWTVHDQHIAVCHLIHKFVYSNGWWVLDE